MWTPAETLDNPFISNPIASPDTTTTYFLTFTDLNGCQATVSVTVSIATPICDDPYIFVPNTFTPNGDQINDQLFVRGAFIDELKFIVFDRWGNQVFLTTDKQIGWDGTYQQKVLGNDVFGYYLEARCYDGQLFTKRGNVTLLRP
ncbi:MAG: gliding motility-associated C-terminal domain-containing protein [Saprospiraceae bacterium]|nr:gliding motility-associated C-terminal domain-containing protein [Saprospiraceae bacterium]